MTDPTHESLRKLRVDFERLSDDWEKAVAMNAELEKENKRLRAQVLTLLDIADLDEQAAVRGE